MLSPPGCAAIPILSAPPRARARSASARWRAPGLRTLVLASLPVGFALGTPEVVLPAFSDEEGSKELAGVLLAIWSLASGAAGLAYGARPAREALTRTHMRFALLLPPAALSCSRPAP